MSKKNRRIREKNNLKIENFGDTVIIKNRSAITGGVSGALLMVFVIAVAIIMRAAWSYYLFWLLFAFLFLSSAYWCVSAAFGKIVLNSPKMTMTVYSPLKKEYKFRDINYVDVKSAKPKDGFVVHTVSVYIGDGKKSVKIDTLSSEQAEELSALLRGMLDSAAMEYPEGNEEPFNLDKEEKKATGSLFKLFKKKAEPAATDTEDKGDAADVSEAVTDGEADVKCDSVTKEETDGESDERCDSDGEQRTEES